MAGRRNPTRSPRSLAFGAALFWLCGALQAGQDGKKPPAPDAAAQKEAEKLVRDVFKTEYARKTPADRVALANKLLLQAAQTGDDPTTRFVLLCEASEQASQGGDTELALKAIDDLARHYEADTSSMKYGVLSAAAKAAKTPEALGRLGRAQLKVADEFLAADRYDEAIKAVDAADDLGRRAKDPALTARAGSKTKEAYDRKDRFGRVKKARETLATSPEDPAANLAVGQFECLVKGDWESGLPRLAKGPDSPLKSLATRDLAGAKDAAERATLGDGWWDQSEKETTAAKANLRARAQHWYEQAAPEISGLSKVRLLKRLGELRMDKFKGAWIDLQDPRNFGLTGKAGDPIELAPAANSLKLADFTKFPPGEFDGVSVRLRFPTDVREANGILAYERKNRALFIDARNDKVAITQFDGVKWVNESAVKVDRREEYVLTVILVDGEYVLHVDGTEVGRHETKLTRLISVSLQADYAKVTFDQFKLRKKE